MSSRGSDVDQGHRRVTRARDSDELSPNQRAKRDQIVQAAVEVLLREGVHGCTVRSIAAVAGVSKGAVHYYFEDVDEIVDRAILHATGTWLTWLRDDVAAGGEGGPSAVFWRTMTACLEPFAHGDRLFMPLWLEYWALASRADRLSPLREVQRHLVDYLVELLGAMDVEDAEGRARGVLSYLFGVVMQHSVVPTPRRHIERHIAALCGLEPPAGGGTSR